MTNVGMQALKAKEGQLATEVIQSLEKVGSEADKPEISTLAAQSLQQLSSTAKQEGLYTFSALAEKANANLSLGEKRGEAPSSNKSR